MTFTDRILLKDGGSIPNLGFGCWNAYGDDMRRAVAAALACGYRYIDSAARYQNEADVGRGLRDAAAARTSLYVLSKLWPLDFDAPERALDQTLRDLQLDYLDAYLIHWPGTDAARRHRAIEALLPLRGKKFQTLGVSNFQIEHLRDFYACFGFYPAINEIELHPFYQERALSEFCRAHDIALVAWGPLYRARAMEHPVITALAQTYQKTPAQILLRWHLQSGHIPIPKSQRSERIRENCAVFDFSLDADAMQALNDLDSGLHIGYDPYTYNGEISR